MLPVISLLFLSVFFVCCCWFFCLLWTRIFCFEAFCNVWSSLLFVHIYLQGEKKVTGNHVCGVGAWENGSFCTCVMVVILGECFGKLIHRLYSYNPAFSLKVIHFSFLPQIFISIAISSGINFFLHRRFSNLALNEAGVQLVIFSEHTGNEV